jgi:hypothetical protein
VPRLNLGGLIRITHGFHRRRNRYIPYADHRLRRGPRPAG